MLGVGAGWRWRHLLTAAGRGQVRELGWPLGVVGRARRALVDARSGLVVAQRGRVRQLSRDERVELAGLLDLATEPELARTAYQQAGLVLGLSATQVGRIHHRWGARAPPQVKLDQDGFTARLGVLAQRLNSSGRAPVWVDRVSTHATAVDQRTAALDGAVGTAEAAIEAAVAVLPSKLDKHGTRVPGWAAKGLQAWAQRALTRAAVELRVRAQGPLVGLFDGMGAVALVLPLVVTSLYAATFLPGVDPAHAGEQIASMGNIGALATTAGLVFASVFGDKLGVRWVLASIGVGGAAAFGAMSVASIGWLLLPMIAVAVWDSSAGADRGLLNKFPLSDRLTNRRNGVVQTWFNISLLLGPLTVVTLAEMLGGLRPALAVAGLAWAALGIGRWWSLRGAPQQLQLRTGSWPARQWAAASEAVTDAAESITTAASRARGHQPGSSWAHR